MYPLMTGATSHRTQLALCVRRRDIPSLPGSSAPDESSGNARRARRYRLTLGEDRH